MAIFRTALAFIAAVLVAAVLGSLWQTQVNLAAIAALGHDIPMLLRLRTSVEDLIGFAPVFAALCALALLIAFVATAVLLRWIPTGRRALFALAGAVAIVTMLAVMQWLLPVTAIAAARSIGGVIGLAASGAIAGLCFATLTSSAQPGRAAIGNAEGQ